MTSDKPQREGRETAADPGRATGETWPAAESEQAWEGGDPACWAGLVCQECGSMISEGHRDWCSLGTDPAGR